MKHQSSEWKNAQKFCMMDCRQHYYEIKDPIREPYHKMNYYDLTIHQTLAPHLVVNYSPKITLIELISGLGGLLGLWFGMSVFALYHYYGRLRRRVVRKGKQLIHRLTSWGNRKFMKTPNNQDYSLSQPVTPFRAIVY